MNKYHIIDNDRCPDRYDFIMLAWFENTQITGLGLWVAVGWNFTTEVGVGDIILYQNQIRVVSRIQNSTTLNLVTEETAMIGAVREVVNDMTLPDQKLI